MLDPIVSFLKQKNVLRNYLIGRRWTSSKSDRVAVTIRCTIT